jgi:ferric-dicitrate binding protein FerR (iron transport regulator)
MENPMHLSDEQIAKLIDNKIEGKEREKCLDHLSYCQDCFEVYAESSKFLEKEVNEPPKKQLFMLVFKSRQFLRLAAGIILLISALCIWNLVSTSSQKDDGLDWNRVSVANGVKKTMTLADGTRVVLDSGTLFYYPQTFDIQKRFVRLEGEGYFTVTPDKNRPFVIHANHALIKVVGTQFNVRAWNNTKRVEVAVAEGKVLLESQDRNIKNAIGVIGGQVGIICKNKEPSIKKGGNIVNHLGWLHRDMVFTNVPLKDILLQLERWYNVSFIVENTISLTDHLTIHLQNKPIKTILELIADLTDLHYEVDGNRVTLYTGPQKDY